MSGGIDPNVYKKKQLIDHINDIPDTYVGSVEHMPRQDWLMMPSEDGLLYGLEMHEHDTPKAVFRLLLEIISNAGDAVQKSREMGIPVSYIKVTVDNQWVSVENDGAPVPVASSAEFPDQLAPDIIFGELLTSSHYDKDKIKLSAGKNGYGAKLVNIFSSRVRSSRSTTTSTRSTTFAAGRMACDRSRLPRWSRTRARSPACASGIG